VADRYPKLRDKEAVLQQGLRVEPAALEAEALQVWLLQWVWLRAALELSEELPLQVTVQRVLLGHRASV
jgi:hypothetical protein